MAKTNVFIDESESFFIGGTGALMLYSGGPITEYDCVVSSEELEDFAHWILDELAARKQKAEAAEQYNG